MWNSPQTDFYSFNTFRHAIVSAQVTLYIKLSSEYHDTLRKITCNLNNIKLFQVTVILNRLSPSLSECIANSN